MNSKTRKALTIAVFIVFLSVVGGFPVNDVAQAQEDNFKAGEIAGGKSDSIPIQLHVGEMIQGEIIAPRSQKIRLSLSDFSGKSICLFGETSTRGGFYYAAETDGQHYLVVTNPDAFSVGTRGYNLTWSIVPTDLEPGSGTCRPVTEDVTDTSPPWTMIWIITGVIVFLGVLLLMARSR